MREFNIGKYPIGEGHPAFVIAEMAWAHDGSVEKAEKIICAAAEAGADAISVHVTSLPDYMIRKYGNLGTLSNAKSSVDIYAYLENISISHDSWAKLCGAAKKAGLAVCIMPNDLPSLNFAAGLDPDAFVLPAACFIEEDFIAAMGKFKKPVVLRVGGATLGEIENALKILKAAGSDKTLLLHGFQIYPTPLEETHIRMVRSLTQIFGYPVGMADHIDGGTEEALFLPLLALPMGAVSFEKHITWDRNEKGEDYESALDPKMFARFVQNVRLAEKVLGQSVPPPFSEAILKYRQVSRKRVVAARDIPAETVIGPEHIICKRSDAGLIPTERTWVIGRKAKSFIPKDMPILYESLN